VSGATAKVMSAEEAQWFNNSRDRYLDETRFTENTDVQDLDRLVQLELLLFRWNQWMLAGVDYEGAPRRACRTTTSGTARSTSHPGTSGGGDCSTWAGRRGPRRDRCSSTDDSGPRWPGCKWIKEYRKNTRWNRPR
jgi:hypothetical protein